MSGLSLLERMRRVGLLALAESVASRHHITVGEMLGRRRTTQIVRARQEFYVALRRKGFSYPEIGRIVGRDHTTVLHACRGLRVAS